MREFNDVDEFLIKEADWFPDFQGLKIGSTFTSDIEPDEILYKNIHYKKIGTITYSVTRDVYEKLKDY